MAAAVALAVVLVIAVGGVSLAMQSQRPLQPQPRPRPEPRPQGPTVRARPRRTPPPRPEPVPPPNPVVPPDPEAKGPELLRTGVAADAKVVNVVDERILGPVTRSRLTLRFEPEGTDAVEIDLRHTFASPEARAKVKVGGTLAVHYDKERPKKVVIDPIN